MDYGGLYGSTREAAGQLTADPPLAVVVNAGKWTLLLPGDPSRVALVLGCRGVSGVFLSTYGGLDVGAGWPLPATAGPLVLRFADVGPLIQLPWYALGGDATDVVTVQSVIVRASGDQPANVGGA